jgi:hypothetical protein
MFNQILLLILTLTSVSLAAAAVYALFHRTIAAAIQSEAQSDLLGAQAAHVNQQAEAELLLRENTIKAYEQQGVSKFKTELARGTKDAVSGTTRAFNIREIEAKLGSKILGFSPEEHEKELAQSRKIILDLQSTIALYEERDGSWPASVAGAAKPDYVDQIRAEANASDINGETHIG